MRILLTNYRYFISGGPERYMFNIIERLEEEGHTIAPLSVRYSCNRPTRFSDYFVSPIGTEDEVYFRQQKKDISTTFRTMGRLFYSREAATAMARLLADFHPDVAYVLHYLRKLSPSILVPLKEAGVPIVVRLSDYGMVCPQVHCLRNGSACTLCLHGDLLPSVRHRCVMGSLVASGLNAMATWFHRSRGWFDCIDAFVVTNPFMAAMMVEAGYPHGKIRHITTFTDIDTFFPEDDHFRRTHILYAGRLEEIKGVHVLIEALALVKKRYGKDIPRLLIAGTGLPAYENLLKSRVEALGLNHMVRFTGQVDTAELAKLQRQALFSVIPSLLFENLPNTLLESLASGTPVLVSDTGTLRESVKGTGTGLLFNTGDAEDLAEKMIHCLDHPVEVKKMSRRAREKALRDHSPATHLHALSALFQELCS